jgi:hypothetical protein
LDRFRSQREQGQKTENNTTYTQQTEAPTIADFDAALRQRPKKASSLYGRGLAELKKGSASSGNVHIAEAKRIDPGIVQEYEHYGVE